MMRIFCKASLVLMLSVALAALSAGVIGATPRAGGSERTSDSLPHPSLEARGAWAGDFLNVLQIIADLNANPPDEPLVCMLGGSAARECTVSDASWSNAAAGRCGFPVHAVNLGSIHRMFTQDRRLVGYLPKGPSIVFIGVNVGRFCYNKYDPAFDLPEPSASGASMSPAPRAATSSLPNWKRRWQARTWMSKRWPNFRDRHRYNLSVLERACKRSLARGQHPVIIDMPRNMQIIGHLLDRPMRIYHRKCRALASRLGIPYVQLQGRTGLTNRDFSDLWHLRRSGQVKWQRQLSVTTAQLLVRYDMGPRPTPSPSPSSSPTSSGSPSAAPRL